MDVENRPKRRQSAAGLYRRLAAEVAANPPPELSVLDAVAESLMEAVDTWVITGWHTDRKRVQQATERFRKEMAAIGWKPVLLMILETLLIAALGLAAIAAGWI